tara:strand:+ start:818 stop:1591 length:774 start_codon:yes stop_codon:yes gene_type:complete
MFKPLQSILYVGCDKVHSFDQLKRIILSNQLFIAYECVLISFTGFFWFVDAYFLALSTTFFGTVLLGCLLLNYYKKFIMSRCLLNLILFSGIYFFSAMIGPEGMVQFGSFPSMAVAYILFELDHWSFRYGFILLQISIYVLLEFFSYSFFNISFVPEFNMVVFRFLIFFCVTALILAIIIFYSKLTVYYKRTLFNLLSIYTITMRESEIILAIVEGKSNKDIAQLLFIEQSTVKTHLSRIYKKLGVDSRTQLVAKIG